jgi:biotin-(acetyl-CoA carboxylase) ligase
VYKYFSIQDRKVVSTGNNETLQIFSSLINNFVWVKKKDGKVAAGILKKVTDDGYLLIQGKYKIAYTHYEEIVDFSARRDRDNRGGNNAPS